MCHAPSTSPCGVTMSCSRARATPASLNPRTRRRLPSVYNPASLRRGLSHRDLEKAAVHTAKCPPQARAGRMQDWQPPQQRGEGTPWRGARGEMAAGAGLLRHAGRAQSGLAPWPGLTVSLKMPFLTRVPFPRSSVENSEIGTFPIAQPVWARVGTSGSEGASPEGPLASRAPGPRQEGAPGTALSSVYHEQPKVPSTTTTSWRPQEQRGAGGPAPWRGFQQAFL